MEKEVADKIETALYQIYAFARLIEVDLAEKAEFCLGMLENMEVQA